MLPRRMALANVVGLRSKGSNAVHWLYLLLPVWLWDKPLNLSLWRQLHRYIHEKHPQRQAHSEREAAMRREMGEGQRVPLSSAPGQAPVHRAPIHFRVSQQHSYVSWQRTLLVAVAAFLQVWEKRCGQRDFPQPSCGCPFFFFFFILVRIPWGI